MELPEDEYRVVATDEPGDEVLEEVAALVRTRREQIAMPEAVTFDCWNTLICEEDWELAGASNDDTSTLADADFVVASHADLRDLLDLDG